MTRTFAILLVLLTVSGAGAARAGFRSPESLVRNVYGFYGNGSSDLSNGLPRDDATVLRPEFARRVGALKQPAVRLLRSEPGLEDWRGLDLD